MFTDTVSGLRFNIYARVKLCEFYLPGINPLPHPEQFSIMIGNEASKDFDGFARALAYCGHCGAKYEVGQPVIFKPINEVFNQYDKHEVYLAFLIAEGTLLKYDEPLNPENMNGNMDVRFEDVMALAFGEMGLKPKEFYQMSWAEFQLASAGYFRKRYRPDENLRTILFTLRSIFRGKDSRVMNSPVELYPLPTDKKTSSGLSEDDMKKMWEIAKKM